MGTQKGREKMAARPVAGVIGLGIMGGAMAEALIAAGYEVYGFDVAAPAQARLRKAGGHVMRGAAQVAAKADLVIVSLATVKALRATVAALTGVRRRGKGLVVIETSTLPLDDKTEAQERLAAAGIATLDCPISGTAVRMKEGNWTIFASGPKEAFERARPLLEVFGGKLPYVGAYGNGTRMKFIANHLVAIYNVAVGESMTFARAMGLDPAQVWELFSASPVVGNGVFKLRGRFMVEEKYRPATMKVAVWQKDMQVIGDMARAVNCPTPLFSASAGVYTTAMARGLAEYDTASVCQVLGEMAGVKSRRRR